MWKQPSRSPTRRPASRDPANTQPSVEVATVPEMMLPGADPAVAPPVETAVSTPPSGRDARAGTRQYKVVMSCHVDQENSAQLGGRTTAGPVKTRS